MTMKQLAMAALVQISVVAPFGSGAFAQGQLRAPNASEIDGKVTAALSGLYSQNEAARALAAKAKAILVFPDIRKGAFIVGLSMVTALFAKVHTRWPTTVPALHRMAFREA